MSSAEYSVKVSSEKCSLLAFGAKKQVDLTKWSTNTRLSMLKEEDGKNENEKKGWNLKLSDTGSVKFMKGDPKEIASKEHEYWAFLKPSAEPSFSAFKLDEAYHFGGETDECVVCGDAADGFHYGVRSCRDCNAFFRRAVTFNMSFICRRGGNCPVDKRASFLCRPCRLAKCYSVGMDKKAVQPKRDLPTSSGSFEHTEDFEMRNSGFFQNSPTTYELSDMTSPPGSAFTPLQFSIADYTPAIPSSPPASTSVLVRQCFEFVEQKQRRRTMLCSTLDEILSDDSNLRLPATPRDFTSIFQAQMILMFEWVEKLPEFRLIKDPMDKTKLLRAFALKYMLIDNVYHTYEMGFNERLVLVNNNFLVPGQPSSFSGETVDDYEARNLMFGEKMAKLVQELVVPVCSNHLLYGELLTIRHLLFWNPGVTVQLSEKTQELASQATNNAMKELHHYLEQEGVENPDERTELILLILPSFSAHNKTMYEIVRLIPSFGKMNDWNCFMDEILGGV